MIDAGGTRRSLDELLEEARRRVRRLEPAAAQRAARAGAVLVDIRSDAARRCTGVIPGALHVPRTVLEWRVEPGSPWRNPHLGDVDRHLILVCDHGFSSSLAAATLLELGLPNVSEVIGGFAAWAEAGLPVASCPEEAGLDELPGMGSPDCIGSLD